MSVTANRLDLSKFLKGTDLSNLKDSEKREKLSEFAEKSLENAKDARNRANNTADRVGRIYDQTRVIKSGKKVE